MSRLGSVLDGLSSSWANAARFAKGGLGSAAGAIGSGAAGLAAGGMQAANAVGGAFGAQPFSDEAIETAYGTADHYADVGSAYGEDFATSLGLGRNGLAGTAMGGQGYGDRAFGHVMDMPGVSEEARAVGKTGMAGLDLASKAFPAAAIGAGVQIASNAATGAPLLAGLTSSSPAAGGTVPSAGLRRAVHKAAGVGAKLNSTSNPLGAGVGIGLNAGRAYEGAQIPVR